MLSVQKPKVLDTEKPISFSSEAGASSISLDRAILYLQRQNLSLDATAVDEKLLLRKVDWRIVPIAFACYTVQFIDKVNINYAAVMGLNKDLALVGNDFSNAATALFWANLAAELCTGFILQKVPLGKWLGINVILWAFTTACTAGVKSYGGLIACRVFLGIFEAATTPCLMLIAGMWYTKSEAATRFSILYCGLGAGQILGGIISFGFQHVSTFAGWRAMCIFLGIFTGIVGVWAFLFMPSNPMEGVWLTEQEKRHAISRLTVNQTGIANPHFKASHLKELALDIQIWILCLLTILISISSGVISTYSSTLIRNFGYTPKQSALLNTPSGLVTIAATMISGPFAGKQSNRWLWVCVLTAPAVIGSALMSFLPLSNKPGLLVGIYLVNTITPDLIMIFSWVTANVAGQTKRVAAAALLGASFSVGNIIGPQTFRAQDAPQYIPAKITLLATQVAAIGVAVTARLYYGWQNKIKDAVSCTERRREEAIENIEWLNLTDKQNETFRYAY